MAKKKVNPRRRPMNMADVKRVSMEVSEEAFQYTAIIAVKALTELDFMQDGKDAVCKKIDQFLEAYSDVSFAVQSGAFKATVAELNNELKERFGYTYKRRMFEKI